VDLLPAENFSFAPKLLKTDEVKGGVHKYSGSTGETKVSEE